MGEMPSSSLTPTVTPSISLVSTVGGAPVNLITLTDEQFRTILERGNGSQQTVLSGIPAPSAQATEAGIPVFVASCPAEALSHESLLNKFPFVSRATILEIVRYEFHPLNLYELDIVAQEKTAAARYIMDIDDGQFTVRERIGSAKDYPTFTSLLEPLLIYFDIIGCYVASSNTAVTLAIFRGCVAYCAHLSALNRTYAWPVILQYHNHFFLKRSREMARGVYSEWAVADGQLMLEYLYGHTRTPSVSNALKSKTSSTANPSSRTSVFFQTCFPFNKGTCTGPTCPAGRIHKCKKCESSSHGASACTKAT